MKYSKEDYIGLLFNVMEVPGKVAVLTHFQALGEYPEFHAKLSNQMNKYRSNIVKYIVLMYDRKSPFKRIEDITERKIQAALEAGFKPVRNKTKNRKYFVSYVDDMLKGLNHDVNKMAIRYCRIQGNMKYSFIVAAMEDFYSSIYQSMNRSEEETSKDSQVRQQMLREAKKNMDEVEGMALEMLNDDNNLLLKQDLYVVIEDEDRKRLRISPESRLIKEDDGEEATE